MPKKALTKEEWLKRIDQVQNIDKLSDLEKIDLTGLLRFFLAMDMRPVLVAGRYDRTSQRYILNQDPVTDTLVSVASVASLTLTCPANTRRNVTLASLRNNNRAPTGTLTYTPFGGVATVLGPILGTATATLVMLGGTCINVDLVAILQGMKGPLRMQTGDTLLSTDGAYQAADVMRHDFIFEDETIA